MTKKKKIAQNSIPYLKKDLKLFKYTFFSLKMVYILSAMHGIAQTYKNVDFEKIIKTYEGKLQDLRGCL